MKNNLFIAVSLLFFLWTGNYSFAQTYSSVVVTPVTANYSATPPTITFKVSWPAGSRDADHHSKIWLLVDYRRYQNNAYSGGWLRAGIDALPATNAGTVSLESGNTKGFWLQGPDDGFAFAATVTVPVTVNIPSGYAPQFGWCGVASDRPPWAEEKTGYYALYGTPGFIVNGTALPASEKAYIGCIYSLADSTGCPGVAPDMPAITDFTASTTTICKGGSVTLTAVAGSAASYSFNNGAWSSSSTTVVSPTSTTAYTLRVRSAGGCTVTSSKTVTVTVNDPPVPQSLTADPLTVCTGEPATLTATAGGAASYSLNGSTWTASHLLTDSPASSKTYTLYIKNAAGCTASLPNAATVTVRDTPAAPLASSPQTFCSGSNPTVANLSATGTDIKWYSSSAGGAALTTSTGLPSGTYYASQTTNGCEGPLTAVTVTVNTTPAAPLASSPQTFCSGSNPTVANLPATGTDIKWYSVSSNGQALATSAALASGTYYASQTTNGCESPRAAVTVTINTTPAPPTSPSNNSRCGAGTVTFSATVPGDCTIDWFNGPTGDGMLAEGATAYTPDLSFGTTSYWARARNLTTGCHSLERLQVKATVNALPTGLSLSGATVCSGAAATLNADAAGAASYSINNADWQTAKTFTVSPTSTTTYTLYVKSAEGCTATKAGAATVTVHTAVAQATISGNASNTCPATSVSLYATASGATTFTWYRNSSPVQTGTSSAYTVTSSGNYTVQGKNANCTGSTSITKVVTISACGNVPGCTNLTLLQTSSASDGLADWYTADEYCRGAGARLPTTSEMLCLCEHESSVPGTLYTRQGYWTVDCWGDTGTYVFKDENCNTQKYASCSELTEYFRCVK